MNTKTSWVSHRSLREGKFRGGRGGTEGVKSVPDR